MPNPKPNAIPSLFLLIILALSAKVVAQQSLPVAWSKTVGDTLEHNTEAWGVDVDAEGLVFWPINQKPTNGDMNVHVYAFDENGADLWAQPQQYTLPFDQFSHLCDASSSHLYIGGSSCVLSGINCDMSVLKVDKDQGSLIWERSFDFGNNGYDEIDGLELDENGLYCTGWAQALEAGLWRLDLGLWRLDFDGNTLWSRHHGQPGTAEHQDGHIVLEDDRMVGTGLWGGTSISNLFNGQSLLAAFSLDDGSILDSSLFNITPLPTPYLENPLSMTTDGQYYYVTGYTNPASFNNQDLFVAKFDLNFNPIWSSSWGGSGGESARAIVVEGDRIFVGGLTESPAYTLNGDGDALLLVLDTSGMVLSHYVWGNEMKDAWRDMVLHDGALYLSGTSGTAFSTQESFFANLIKVPLEDIITADEDQLLSAAPLHCYPNPTSDYMILDIPDELHWVRQLHIYSASGVLVHRQDIRPGFHQITLDLPPGSFHYQLLGAKNRSYTGRFIVQP